jgi:carboxypeptidase C (cathepsin A)
MDGLFLELGPLRLDAKGNTVKINPHSWHNVANLLFIDQPVGTGLSYTTSRDGYAKNDDEINKHFYKFLQSFFELHPRYTSTNDKKQKVSRSFFMSGESHAGHYIPSMSAHILNKNKEVQATSGSQDVVISLEGIALGELYGIYSAIAHTLYYYLVYTLIHFVN